MLGWTGVSGAVPGESEPPVETVAWARVPRSVPEGSGLDWDHKGHPGGSGPGCGSGGRLRGLCAGPGRRPQRSPRRSGRAGVAGGGGAPPPHIKAGGAAGEHKAGRAGAERGRGGRDPGGPGGRVVGGREGTGRAAGCAGAARPLLT